MLPARLKIKRVWWTVEVTDTWIYYGKQKCRGLCDGNTRTIYVYGGQRKKAVISTFWHEVLHAIDFTYGINIPHHVIYAIEGAMTDLIAKNPAVGQLKPALQRKSVKGKAA